MFGTLRAVGWARHVPELLKDGPPPEASRYWERLKEQVGELLNRNPQPMDDDAFTSSSGPDPPTVRPPQRFGEIEWFDPDLDPVDFIIEPPEEDDQADGSET